MANWKGAALALAERSQLVAVLAGPSGQIHLATSACARLFGAASESLVGRSWADFCATPDERKNFELALATALRDGRAACRVTLQTDESSYDAEIEIVPVGADGTDALIVVGSFEMLEQTTDFFYEVADHYRLVRLTKGGAAGEVQAGARCHEAVFGRPQPCEDCPLEGARRHRRAIARPGEKNTFLLLSVEPITSERVRVRVRSLPSTSLSAMHSARLRAASERAGLSPREMAVLSHVAQGSDPADISASLGITARTVKFHQRNALDKLGFDSRQALWRYLWE